jgi:5'-deoxynucleotidase YfbR-like HD superfamily hydrolase
MNKVATTLNMVRSGGTMRYHCQAGETLKPQDVAQHSYGVFWFAYVLTHGSMRREMMLAIMSHDAGERWIGDVPAPTKRVVPGLGAKLNELESEAVRKRGGVEPQNLTPGESLLLKLADYLDGAAFCDRELKMGNTLMRGVLNNFIAYLDELYGDNLGVLTSAPFVFDVDAFTDLMMYFRSVK